MCRQPTEAQRAASRRNGAKSRGPVTARGKAISSRNACRPTILDWNACFDHEADPRYRAELAAYLKCFRPSGEIERALVQSVAVACWRAARLLTLETAVLNAAREALLRSGDPRFLGAGPNARLFLAFKHAHSAWGDLQRLYRLEPQISRDCLATVADANRHFSVRDKIAKRTWKVVEMPDRACAAEPGPALPAVPRTSSSARDQIQNEPENALKTIGPRRRSASSAARWLTTARRAPRAVRVAQTSAPQLRRQTDVTNHRKYP